MTTHKLSAFDSLVIGAVAILGEVSGAEVRRIVEGNWHVPQHVVDKALRRMRQRGLVEETERADNVLLYSITEAGQHALAGEL